MATAADVARGATEGDPLAHEVFTDSAEALGIGVVNCIHIFNPDIVVLGGGVTNAGELLFGPVKRMVDRHAMAIMRRDVAIVHAQLGEDAGLTGAAALARDFPRGRQTASAIPNTL
jgi:glucokinase